MTKLICIENFHEQLTINKIYDGKPDNKDFDKKEGWYIEEFNNAYYWYPDRCFMLLSEWRQQQIDSILG